MALREHAREAGVDAVAHAARGDVVSSIAEAATKLGADLLVVGSRGLGSLSGAVLGSVSHARAPLAGARAIARHAAVHAVAASSSAATLRRRRAASGAPPLSNAAQRRDA